MIPPGSVAFALLLVSLVGTAAAHTITTVAGTGTAGISGDGGPATSAKLIRPIGVVLDGRGNLSIADTGNLRIRKVAGAGAGARPAITAPSEGSRVSRGSPSPVGFAWTAVSGATQYGFEHTGPSRQFANPNGTGPDPVNGLGAAGARFAFPGTSLTITLVPSIPPGTYQVRVIGLSQAGQPIGVFSDAVTVVLE